MNNLKTIARTISLLENHADGYENILMKLETAPNFKNIIGITGSPGAGKSTLTDGLIGQMILHQNKVAVLCIDPSSPFNMGALLGDRIRMSEWYNEPNVFIRSFGSRNALGGLCPTIIEVTEYLKSCGFDFIIIETVGVGQNEIDIASLADITVLTLVPEGGDEIQNMKSGIMEIADIIVVNKADRPGADLFVKNLHNMLSPVFHKQAKNITVLKTIAHEKIGIDELYKAIIEKSNAPTFSEKRYLLLVEKAYQLIQQKRMVGVDKTALAAEIKSMYEKKNNLFQVIEKFAFF